MAETAMGPLVTAGPISRKAVSGCERRIVAAVSANSLTPFTFISRETIVMTVLPCRFSSVRSASRTFGELR